MKAVFLDRGSFPDHINIQLPVKVIDVVTYENTPIELVAERIKDANIVLTNKVVVDATAINGAADLKLVQVMATGTNNIDLDACKDKNISVQNVSGYSTTSVPEHTFAMLLALRRSLFSYLDAVKAGRWSSSEYFCFLDYPIKDLSGSTMAIFGNGSLGKEVAAIALAFGMKVVFAERKGATNTRPGYICFEEALKVADVININCPLTPETKDLISDDEFSLMKNSCLLLNISRGGIVDESALVRAFENNAIAGAAFDVATQEPMPLDNPLQSLRNIRTSKTIFS
ncbi:D-2-hydroxyacid dehydrogenase [Marinomonas foliarum]|uniref:Glycerate dehydrogenase n=1 Tax=Marinomonas foliarum TaxID=491950 RepID=A0A368ZLD0_9GAMM|nr:D-2-hydroxyacid dehydrogenase [Marinomonas foliarum]RCW94414.1 glycerate dehydrogenase [Marinomonas foliarum]